MSTWCAESLASGWGANITLRGKQTCEDPVLKRSSISFLRLSRSFLGKREFPTGKSYDSPGEAGGLLLVLEGLFVRNSQFLPALLPARSKYAATIGSGHSLTETVFVLSFLAGRLVRAFHGRSKLGVQRWTGFFYLQRPLLANWGAVAVGLTRNLKSDFVELISPLIFAFPFGGGKI